MSKELNKLLLRPKKEKIIISVVVAIIILIILIVNLLSKNSDKITYNEKFVSEDGNIWLEFNKDGTCNRNIKSVSCNYEIDDNNIILKEKQSIYGTIIETEMHYKIIDKENLIHIYSCLPDATDRDSLFYCDGIKDLSIKYSLDNIFIEKNEEENNEEENSEEQVSEEIVRDTNMLHLEDNYYYICFSNDSLERVKFGFRKNGTFRVVYSQLKMSITSAKYEDKKVDDGIYFTDNNYIYMGKTKSKIIFGPNEGVKTQVFDFGGTECYVRDSNPKADNEDKNDDTDINDNANNSDSVNNNSENQDNKNNNNDDNNNNNNSSTNNQDNVDANTNNSYPKNPVDNNTTNNTTTKPIPTYEELANISKEKLDKVTVELKPHYENYFEVVITSPELKYFSIKVNNENYSIYDTISIEAQNNGENCVDVTLTDDYNYSRTINKCVNFNAQSPNFDTWKYDLAPNGICEMRLRDLSNSSGYNNKNLSCVFDNGKKFDCSDKTAFTIPMGTYSLTITNKYGLSQTIPIVCKK